MRNLLLLLVGFIAGAGFMLTSAVMFAPKQEHLLDTWEEMN